MFVIVSCQLLGLCSCEQYLWRWIVTISVYIYICLVSGSSGWALAAYAAARAVHAALACNFHLWETPLNGNQTDIIVKSIKYSGGCCKYFLALLNVKDRMHQMLWNSILYCIEVLGEYFNVKRCSEMWASLPFVRYDHVNIMSLTSTILNRYSSTSLPTDLKNRGNDRASS